MTLKSINAKLAKSGYPDIELERGKGYLYFIFDDRGPGYDTESVMVPYLKFYTDDEWVAMGKDYGERMREKMKDRGQFGESVRANSPFAPMQHTKLVFR
jgi:hypothetical protein